MPRRWGRPSGAVEGVYSDVVMVAARRKPSSIDTDVVRTLHSDVKAQNLMVEVRRTFKVGDLQMYVADTDLWMNWFAHGVLRSIFALPAG